MKSKRQNEIIEIISTADIETQEELAAGDTKLPSASD